MEGKMPRPAPVSGAGWGIWLGGRRFQGPGGPVTNSRASFSPNLHPFTPHGSQHSWTETGTRQTVQQVRLQNDITVFSCITSHWKLQLPEAPNLKDY